MPTKTNPNDEPIFEKVKRLVPPVDHIATALALEHQTAERIHRLLLIVHAGLAEMSEQLNQAITDSADVIDAQATLISGQHSDMRQIEEFSDRLASSRTIVENIWIYFAEDVPSIKGGLEIVNLHKLTQAAKGMKLSRVADVIDALLKATEGR